MARYSHVLFDADDTLLDFKSASFKAFTAFIKEYLTDHTHDVKMLYSHYHYANNHVWSKFEKGEISIDELKTQRFNHFFEIIGQKGRFDQLEEISSYYLNELVENSTMLPHAREIIAFAKEGRTVSLITNGIKAVQLARLQKLALENAFHHVFISEEIGHSKPSALFFDHVFATLDHPDKNQVLVVGDSIKADIVGGINYNVDVCWIKHDDSASGEGCQINYEINSLAELYQIL